MTVNNTYVSVPVNDLNIERDNVAWYWRLIALIASWMILGGYLIIPPLFCENPEEILKPSESVVTIFVVALLVAGYSFTGLLCFACKSLVFQAESIFLPSMASSALGLLTVLYSFIAYKYFHWNKSAVAATVLSVCMTAVYALLLLITNRQIARQRAQLVGRTAQVLQHEQPWYTNYITNMFPSMRPSDPYSYSPPLENACGTEYHGAATPNYPVTEDEGMRRNMAMLLSTPDARPSPDANQSTFQLSLPQNEDSDTEQGGLGTRRTRSHMDHPSLEQPSRTLWPHRTRGSISVEARGRTDVRSTSGEMRAKSREERRQEIELGRVSR